MSVSRMAAGAGVQPEGQLDPIRLAVLTHRLDGVVATMMNTLQRSARSAIISVARDFSCGIVTAEDEILTISQSLPSHSFRGPDLQARVMRELNAGFRRGDAFLNNSPYHGNSHAADWCILAPVIDDAGNHWFTVFVKAHLADCGNSVPTTFFTGARDVYNEGALVFPSVKIQDQYAINQEFIRMCQVRIRAPKMWYGDFMAMLGAVRVGEQRLLEVVDEVGAETLRAYERAWFDYCEQRMLEAIRRLPAGATRVTLRHDPIPDAPDGIAINVDLVVDPGGGRITVDLTDNPDCMANGLNLTEATAASSALTGVFSGLGTDVPTNAGSFRCVDVRLRHNCIVGIPEHPVSCSVATTNLTGVVAQAVLVGLAGLADGFGMAQVGRVLPPAMGVISGIDRRPGRGAFVNFVCLLVTNGAGAPQADGWLTLIAAGVAGLQLHDSVEIDELKYPIIVHAQRLVPDSEGAGRFRGAPAAYVEYGPFGTEVEVMYTSDGTFEAPIGVRGGLDGSPARQYRRTAEGDLVELPNSARIVLQPGESIVSVCTSGGGYGRPTDRDPELVRKDVWEGWISVERAEAVYGVVVTDAGELDLNATEQLRSGPASTGAAPPSQRLPEQIA